MEAYVAQPIEEGQNPKTPVEAVAHVLPKSTFLRNVLYFKTCGMLVILQSYVVMFIHLNQIFV